MTAKKEFPQPKVETYRREELEVPVVFTAVGGSGPV